MIQRVAIIGGGVVGLFTAYFCRSLGFDVTVIEKQQSERQGASFANAGIIVPSHFVPLAAPGAIEHGLRSMLRRDGAFAIRARWSLPLLRWAWLFRRASTLERVRAAAPVLSDLHLASLELYQDVARTAGDPFHLEQRGLLMLCATEHGLEEEVRLASWASDLGLATTILNAQEIADLESGVRAAVQGGVHYAADAHLDPAALMAWLERSLLASGVQFRWSTDVVGWKRTAGTVSAVSTRGEDIPADAFVVSAGVGSATLLRELGLRIPLEAGRGYSVTVKIPVHRPRVPAILSEASVAVTPMGGSVRFGGTLELVGTRKPTDYGRVRAMLRSVHDFFPKIDEHIFEGAPILNGLRPCSPDGLPYIGKVPSANNVVVATGHAMLGVSLAPITGKLVADLLAGEDSSFDLDLLRPERYA